MSEKHDLNQQISTMHELMGGLAAPALAEITRSKPLAALHMRVLESVVKTLVFMSQNEQIIRDAIASAKSLDAADTHR